MAMDLNDKTYLWSKNNRLSSCLKFFSQESSWMTPGRAEFCLHQDRRNLSLLVFSKHNCMLGHVSKSPWPENGRYKGHEVWGKAMRSHGSHFFSFMVKTILDINQQQGTYLSRGIPEKLDDLIMTDIIHFKKSAHFPYHSFTDQGRTHNLLL